MRRADLHYELPPELIAQQPVTPRDSSRLLVLDRATGQRVHRTFRDLGEYLQPGDCLVLNDTRVIPARFACCRQSGGRIEALFLHESGGEWHLLLKPTRRLAVGEFLVCDGDGLRLELVRRLERGEWVARPVPETEPVPWLERVGETPLPPYIQRAQGPDAEDVTRYQTVYAQRAGAVAAPTAGLHFTPELLGELEQAGVRRVQATLHVGAGTFQPITAERLTDHQMHAEWFDISAEVLATLAATRAAGGRIVAVGTTATRVLESIDATIGGGTELAARQGWTEIFIYPPYQFRNVDVLLTNFHLPESTLLALIMALATPEQIRAAYADAVAQRYRFYSYGDAMLIV
ncbi:MAG: tRNA preQ1(34) S-adenosylmethionine ribosyltransferase-isomerase QueA [Phycisphaerae bacterium]|nr:tRNA preQ1(34) S-adenosylmethionine ribosyltransferase-isomerase QueA [Phycisphaerae bacterium]